MTLVLNKHHLEFNSIIKCMCNFGFNSISICPDKGEWQRQAIQTTYWVLFNVIDRVWKGLFDMIDQVDSLNNSSWQTRAIGSHWQLLHRQPSQLLSTAFTSEVFRWVKCSPYPPTMFLTQPSLLRDQSPITESLGLLDRVLLDRVLGWLPTFRVKLS